MKSLKVKLPLPSEQIKRSSLKRRATLKGSSFQTQPKSTKTKPQGKEK